jgi:hypothetical protein
VDLGEPVGRPPAGSPRVTSRARAEDLDETSRVLLMLQDARRHNRVVSADLAGTVINAAAKHSQIISMADAFDLVGRVRTTNFIDENADGPFNEINELITKVEALQRGAPDANVTPQP